MGLLQCWYSWFCVEGREPWLLQESTSPIPQSPASDGDGGLLSRVVRVVVFVIVYLVYNWEPILPNDLIPAFLPAARLWPHSSLYQFHFFSLSLQFLSILLFTFWCLQLPGRCLLIMESNHWSDRAWPNTAAKYAMSAILLVEALRRANNIIGNDYWHNDLSYFTNRLGP